LDHRADINRKNYPGCTALHMAATCGQTRVVELLLSRHADVNAADFSAKTALFCASNNGHAEIVELLKNYSAREEDRPKAFLNENGRRFVPSMQNSVARPRASL
jgi:ankyrin repeat protein